MNDNFKELIKQAGGINHGEDNEELTPMLVGNEIEKYSILLINDCIRTIQMGISRDGHDTEKYKRSMKHIKDIREHFGIEQ